MNKQLIRNAIELADGWEIVGEYGREAVMRSPYIFNMDERIMLDAVSAQLVRQVDNASRDGMSDILIKRLDRDYDEQLPIDRTMEDIEDCVEWLSNNATVSAGQQQ